MDVAYMLRDYLKTALHCRSNLDRRRTRPPRRPLQHRASKENHIMSDETEVVEVVGTGTGRACGKLQARRA